MVQSSPVSVIHFNRSFSCFAPPPHAIRAACFYSHPAGPEQVHLHYVALRAYRFRLCTAAGTANVTLPNVTSITSATGKFH